MQPLPFEELFWPLVLEASDELHRQTGAAAWELLTSEAHSGWTHYLLSQLSAAGSKAAHWQFQIFKTVRAVFPAAGRREDGVTDSLYRQFVGPEPKLRLGAILDEFPALVRLCQTLAGNWIATVAEFLTRLEADRSGFGLHFREGAFVCSVTKIEAGLSDAHRGGRCVVRMVFHDGASLIYKPRSIAAEACFSALLAQINTSSAARPFRPPTCWDRGDYGWMEDIKQDSCNTRRGVHAFYWRAGALLGLVYLARGVDFHRENLVAAGECPVLVDLEGLWHPLPRTEKSPALDADTVLQTGFLPHRNSTSGKAYDRGALSLHVRVNRPATTTWVNINQDDMDMVKGRRTFEKQFHLPTIAGAVHLASKYASDVKAGYRWAGKHLLGNKVRREKFNRWLHSLVRCRRRHILRSTVRYHAVIEQLTSPRFLRTEQTQAESTAGLHRDDPPLQEDELRALRQLDVPYFEQAQSDPGNDPSESLLAERPGKEKYLSQIPVIADCLTIDSQAHTGHQRVSTVHIGSKSGFASESDVPSGNAARATPKAGT